MSRYKTPKIQTWTRGQRKEKNNIYRKIFIWIKFKYNIIRTFILLFNQSFTS